MRLGPARIGAALALRVSAAALACGAGFLCVGARADPLAPWQMVRSLQLLQDRIADGDQAALPMQRRLLAMTDGRLRESTRAELADLRNFDAVMVYAMGGGNPATVQTLMPDLLAIADQLDAPPPPPKEESEDAGHAEDVEAGHEAAANGEAAQDHATAGEAHDATPEAGSHAEPADLAAGGETPAHGKAAGGDEPQADKPGGHGEEPDAHGTAEGAGHAAEPAKAADGTADGEGGETAKRAGGHDAVAEDHGAEADHEAKPEKPAGEHGEAAPEHAKASEEHGGAAEGHGKAEGGNGEAAADEHAPPPKVGQRRKLALGVFNYGRGRFREAEAALGPVDPMRERAEVGAYVALIKGSLAANGDPAAALKALDTARLLGPGTLVEEAALRRSVALAATLGDRPRFLLASGQYVRRFLRSPYASQFADGFVAGAVVLHEGLDLEALGRITAGMTPEQEKVVYLRIARRAAIDNLAGLSAYASAKAGALPDAASPAADPRAALYAALPDIAAPDTVGALRRLDGIDPKGLTPSDRALLAAAKAVIGETLAAPPPLPAAPPIEVPSRAPPKPAPAPETGAEAPSPETEAGEEPLEAVDDGGAVTANPASEGTPPVPGSGSAETTAPEATAPEEPVTAAPDAAPTPHDATDAKVAEARKALETVDRILKDATE